ncbi:MAG: 2-oxoglutarate dehydrogenase, E2 component, dihydrolipoamide succinyltransferase [Actinomycetota bacterium]|nr:2-oxoglutarate dehydrogenase, E2 component, dihydrolipoamide succinyltransferase [Actinomycetota bacterium]
MPFSVTLPALGESVTEGTITRWLKQPGDTVEMDEPLLEVSTDKVDTEIPSPAAGTLLEVKVGEDETVEVGAELAVIGEPSEGGDGGDDSSGDSEEQESGDSEEQESDDSGQQESDDAQQESNGAEPDSAQEQQHADAAPAGRDSGSEDTGGEDTGGDSSDKGGSTGTSVTLPALGESVTEGTITRWLKQVGDSVETDEPLLEVSTDKVDTEIPSPTSGTLLEIKVGEDETVEVGAELAVIGSKDAAPAQQEAEPSPAEEQQEEPAQEPSEEQEPEREDEKEAQPEPAAEAPAQQAPKDDAPQDEARQGAPEGEGSRSYVTPLVRKLAAQHDVDLSELTGSGVGGRIRKQDVLEAAKAKEESAKAPAQQPAQQSAESTDAGDAAQPAPSPLRGKTEKMSRLRKVIAARMVESLQTSAQLTTVVEVDVTGIARLRDRVKNDFAQREGVKLSFLPFFAKATIDALKTHPSLNAAIDTEKGEVTYFDAEHLSVAVDTERGLLTPVIKDAGDLSIAGLSRKIADIAERTRTNKITPDELSGGTFTLTNTGSRGALFDTPIINQPQVAILGTGSVVKRPVVIDDDNLGETIAVRHMVYLALTYDHRLVDGANAARFLGEVKQRLQDAAFDV